jgi:hypothetical protein
MSKKNLLTFVLVFLVLLAALGYLNYGSKLGILVVTVLVIPIYVWQVNKPKS